MNQGPQSAPPRGRRRPPRKSWLTPKRAVLLGTGAIVLFGGGGFVAYTAVQQANAPESTPLSLPQIAGFFGGGDPFQEDPHSDMVKEAAVEAMKKDRLKDGRTDLPKLNPVEVAEQGPGGDGIPQANFPPGSTPDPGSNKALAKQVLDSMGWSDQWGCLEKLWMKESGWNERAMNRYSGAYGIPQSLPGSKMASAGADWQTNAATQIKWGVGYIKGRYGTPCGAWSHSMAKGWY